jgi:hypothetical protein
MNCKTSGILCLTLNFLIQSAEIYHYPNLLHTFCQPSVKIICLGDTNCCDGFVVHYSAVLVNKTDYCMQVSSLQDDHL